DDSLPAHIHLFHVQFAIEHEQVRLLADGDAAGIAIDAGDARGGQARHADHFDERHTGPAVEGSHALDHADDAGGERFAVGHDPDVVLAYDRFAAILGAEEVRTVGHVESAVAIGDESKAIRAFDFVS